MPSIPTMTKKTPSRKTKNPRPRLVKGRGDYEPATASIKDPAARLEAKIDHLERSLVKRRVNNAASTVGRTLGNFLGQGDLGAMAGEGLAKLFGHGDYVVKGNSLMGSVPAGNTPVNFSRDGRRGTRITEREYLGDIFSGDLSGTSSQFTSVSFPLNPASQATFPWLSRTAEAFEQWEPHGIVFEFISTSSEFNGTSQALGTVIMATDYDVLDVPYPNKALMENADYACSTKPSQTLMHGIECDPTERVTKLMYTRPTNDSAVGDIRFADLGNFQIATVGCSTAGARLGELWISYDLTLYKKQLNVQGFNYRAAHWNGNAALSNAFALPVSNFTSDITLTQVGSATTFTFPPYLSSGVYQFTYRITTYNALDIIVWTTTKASVIQDIDVTAATSSTKHVHLVTVRINDLNATVVAATAGPWTTLGGWNLDINQVNPDQRF